MRATCWHIGWWGATNSQGRRQQAKGSEYGRLLTVLPLHQDKSFQTTFWSSWQTFSQSSQYSTQMVIQPLTQLIQLTRYHAQPNGFTATALIPSFVKQGESGNIIEREKKRGEGSSRESNAKPRQWWKYLSILPHSAMCSSHCRVWCRPVSTTSEICKIAAKFRPIVPTAGWPWRIAGRAC